MDFSAYLDAGLLLTPLASWNDTTFPEQMRGKRPLNPDWQRAESTPPLSDFNGRNAGWVLQPEHLVLDIDPRNGGFDSLKKLGSDLGLPEGYIKAAAGSNVVKTGGGGYHFYFSKSQAMAFCHTHDEYPGIEVKSAGRQVVIAGCSHFSQKYY